MTATMAKMLNVVANAYIIPAEYAMVRRWKGKNRVCAREGGGHEAEDWINMKL